MAINILDSKQTINRASDKATKTQKPSPFKVQKWAQASNAIGESPAASSRIPWTSTIDFQQKLLKSRVSKKEGIMNMIAE